ncbi:MAG: hypothetical protein ACKODK_11610, partial [Opitutaceae bacterium]
MPLPRRTFLRSAAIAGITATGVSRSRAATPAPLVTKAELDRILDEPVLRTGFLTSPVRVESVDLLRNGKHYLLRTRSADGLEVITVPNPSRMAEAFPIFLKNIRP